MVCYVLQDKCWITLKCEYILIELCQREHISARGRFFALVTLKLEGDLNILKMYLYTKNEIARLRHSKLLTVDEICKANEKIRK